MNETLDPSPLSNTLESLYKALDEYKKDESNEFVRDACIQRFEYCYSLSVKFIERYLALIAKDPIEIEEMSFQNLIRTGYSKGILQNSWDRWAVYRETRNITSHTYNKDKAMKALNILDLFHSEIAFFLDSLKAR